MADILIYSTAHCSYCVAAKNFLKSRGLECRELRIDLDAQARADMLRKSQRRSVPQIFINDVHVGGFDDLVALEHAGHLQPLLERCL